MQTIAPGYQIGDEPSIKTLEYLTKELGRQVGKKVDICRDTGKPEYSLIIRTRQTYFGSKWLKPLDSVIGYINQCDGKVAAQLLDQECGKQVGLDKYGQL
jgi:hypothetical protein